MLKDIRLHLEKDNTKQEKLEKKLAEHIAVTQRKNINSFQRNIPSILPYVESPKLQNYALFCNKFGEFNIVDYGTGRTFYGLHPEQEIEAQVNKYCQRCPYIDLSADVSYKQDVDTDSVTELEALPSYQQLMKQDPLPNQVECLVLLGCGIGTHIPILLQRLKIKYLVIYEPEPQYFQCSSLVADWQHIFDYAKQNGIGIFIQLEKDGRDIVNDIEELRFHEGIAGFHLFQHYNHPVFDSLYRDLTTRDWQDIKSNGINFQFSKHHNEYVTTWTAYTDIDQLHTAADSTLYQNNLDAFKKYFPNIYKEYKEYKPKKWLAVQNGLNQINLLNKSNLTTWYGDSPKLECELNYQNFNEHPNKDGLVLGYTGTKLAHYLHYQFVKETEDLLKEVEDEVGALPEKVASLIMFGMGVGYQLETLLEKHQVERLFLCEPNPDFFYASLHTIDWQKIFEHVDQSNGRIYLNIGDDGTHLFRDLLNQFYAIGPYILNNTYFYQSYHNASLNSAIAQLREQLKVVISMGEYFDHAFYGIAQTKDGLASGYPVLTKSPASHLSFNDKEVPVFIVGNGPSLDLAIETIIEYQDRAIIVSCGTALHALYKHGIRPDFHAEIEQNRATFDWPVSIGDLDYLKTITLLSCNGIHPDTCKLYKDVLIAFKEGESSTVSTLQIIGNENAEVLQFAFPTVGNFATNLFAVLGFNNIYLMGLDFGFINVSHHHSKFSGYYNDKGEELYDYKKKNNTSLVVPGNFRAQVYTKHEFKVAKQILEQVTHRRNKLQTFYNCSDGAKIQGTTPLQVDSILITSDKSQKLAVMLDLKNQAFIEIDKQNFLTKHQEKYSDKLLNIELNKFNEIINEKITSVSQAEDLISKQKELLFLSYQHGRTLLFYYLYGTVNYANAVLSKLLSNKNEDADLPDSFVRGLDIWRNYFEKIVTIINKEQGSFDNSMSPNNLLQRGYNILKHRLGKQRLAVITNSTGFVDALHYFAFEKIGLDKTAVTFITADELPQCLASGCIFDFVIYHFVDEFAAPDLSSAKKACEIMQLRGVQGTTLVDFHFNRNELEALHGAWSGNLTVLKVARDNRDYVVSGWQSDLARTALGSLYTVIECHYHVVFLKYPVSDSSNLDAFSQAVRFEVKKGDVIFSHYRHLCIDFNNAKHSAGLMAVGDRGKAIETLSNHADFIAYEQTKTQFNNANQAMTKLLPTVVKDRAFEKNLTNSASQPI